MGLGVMVCAVTLTACGGSGGSAVTQPGGTQSTQAAPPTTSGVRYVSGASGNQPALDVSLFFAVPAGSIQIARVHSSATVYSVSGGFTAGTVRGTVAGTFTPDTTTATFSGTFTGTLSALLAGGCQAVRTYSGSLTASSLPHVLLNRAVTLKHATETFALPCACHGFGPDRANASATLAMS